MADVHPGSLEPANRTSAVKDWPVSVGLVFPDGELPAGSKFAVMDDRNNSVPFESEVTGWWSAEKKNIKWLLLHFKASTNRYYRFVPSVDGERPTGRPMAVSTADGVVINTGPLQAKLTPRKALVMDSTILNDQSVLVPSASLFEMEDDEGRALGCEDWKLTVEVNSPFRTVVKAEGNLGLPGKEPTAKLLVRYQFFAGESFVRLSHTLIWIPQSLEPGANHISIRLRPQVGDKGAIRIGSGAPLKAAADSDQPSPARAIVSRLSPELQARLRAIHADTPITDGFRARVAHAMNRFLDTRDFYEARAWQGVELKPKAKELLAKGVEKLPDPDRVWLNRLLIESAFPDAVSPTDVPHWNHEYGSFGKGVNTVRHMHTGEGAARTHELTVLFFDKSTRCSVAQVNDLTQRPMVLRQSPEHAMRVPLLGFKFAALDKKKYPDIERALDHYGRSTIARWPEGFLYGFHRFGMQLQGGVGEDLYRYIAGHQYDHILVPWLLFIRGGDRAFYDEGMNIARYGMDVHTNHYNTRGAPPGYGSFTASMPLPHSATHAAFNMKLHYLVLCYHLSGDPRAREVMEMMIQGTKDAYRQKPPRPGNRALYAMNMFFAHAYEETHVFPVRTASTICSWPSTTPAAPARLSSRPGLTAI